MSQRRGAHFGLVLACLMLVVTIGVLYAGSKAGLTRHIKEKNGMVISVGVIEDVRPVVDHQK